MTHNAQTSDVAPITALWVFNLLGRGARKFLRGTHAAVRSLQVARMMATLCDMSDHQLTQIGITRSEIPDYAEKLMEGV